MSHDSQAAGELACRDGALRERLASAARHLYADVQVAADEARRKR